MSEQKSQQQTLCGCGCSCTLEKNPQEMTVEGKKILVNHACYDAAFGKNSRGDDHYSSRYRGPGGPGISN